MSDFTTASKTAFQNPNVRFININVAEFDAFKHAALPLVADARVTLEELAVAVGNYRVDATYASQIEKYRDEWEEEVDRLYHLGHTPLPSQSEVIGGGETNFRVLKMSWSAQQAAYPATCTSCGEPVIRNSTIWNMDTHAWATKSLAALGIKMADPSRDVPMSW